jgi:anti-anti-sigma factor
MSDQQPTLRIGIEKEILQDRNVAVVRLLGLVDVTNAQYLQQTVVNTIEESDIRYLIFDLAGLERIASAGIGSLMAVARKVAEKQGDIVLAGLHDRILSLFRLLGFTTFYKTAPDVEQAKALLRSAADVPASPDKPAVFPLVFACPSCGRKLKVSREGRFKCASCGSVIRIGASGKPELQS